MKENTMYSVVFLTPRWDLIEWMLPSLFIWPIWGHVQHLSGQTLNIWPTEGWTQSTGHHSFVSHLNAFIPSPISHPTGGNYNMACTVHVGVEYILHLLFCFPMLITFYLQGLSTKLWYTFFCFPRKNVCLYIASTGSKTWACTEQTITSMIPTSTSEMWMWSWLAWWVLKSSESSSPVHLWR